MGSIYEYAKKKQEQKPKNIYDYARKKAEEEKKKATVISPKIKELSQPLWQTENRMGTAYAKLDAGTSPALPFGVQRQTQTNALEKYNEEVVKPQRAKEHVEFDKLYRSEKQIAERELTADEKKLVSEYNKAMDAEAQRQYYLGLDTDELQRQIDELETSFWERAKNQFNDLDEANANTQKADELNAELQLAKYYQTAQKYNDYIAADDFERYSTDTSAQGQGWYDLVMGRDVLPSDRAFLTGGNIIKKYDDIVDKYGENSVEAKEFLRGQVAYDDGKVYSHPSLYHMSEGERKIYAYIYNKEGQEAAEEYLNFIGSNLEQRRAEATFKQRERAYDDLSPTAKSVFQNADAVLEVARALPRGLKSSVQGIADYFKDEARDYDYEDYERALIAEKYDGTGYGTAIGTSESVGQMAPAIAANFIPYVGEYVSNAILYTSAAGNAKQEMLRNGYTATTAAAYGNAIGLSELLTEKVLGGIPGISKGNVGKIGNKIFGKVLAKLPNGVQTLVRAGIDLAGNAIGESSEERVQSGLVEPFLGNALLGEDNSYNLFSEEADEAAKIGFWSGLVMNVANIGGVIGKADAETKANNLLVDTAKFDSTAVKKARTELADALAKGEVTQEGVNKVVTAVIDEISGIVNNEINEFVSGEGIYSTEGGNFKADNNPFAAVRDSFSEEGRAAFDIAMKNAVDPEATARQFEINYLRGYKGKTFELGYGSELTPSMQKEAYKYGAEAAKAEAEKLVKSVNMSVERGKVKIADGVKISRSGLRRMNTVAKDTNTGITVGGKAPLDENGNQIRGWYYTDDGRIHIYADAEVTVYTDKGVRTFKGEEAAMMVVFGHELTHRLKTLDGDNYGRFESFVLSKVGEAEVQRRMQKHDWSETKAKEEITCDFAMQYLFADKKTIREITRTDSKFAQKIREIIEWIKSKLGIDGSKKLTAEEYKLKQMLDEAAKLWNDAYRTSVSNVKNGVETKNTADGGMKYSKRATPTEIFSNESLEKNESLDYNKNANQSIKTQKGYTEKQYLNYGWARENDILNEGQNEDYRSKFADAVTGRAKFPKSKAGEYIIPVSDVYDAAFEGVNNVLAFAKGTITDPIITSVIHIYEYDETSLDRIRRRIYDCERRGIQQEAGRVFGRYYASDFEFRPNQQGVSSNGVRNSSDNGHGRRSSEETSSVDGKITAIDGDVQHSTSGDEMSLFASIHEQREVWKRVLKMTPMQIANMQLSDIDPLPKRTPKAPSGINAENGKESKFYGSAMESENVADDTKRLIKTVDDIRYYAGVSNEETLNEANDRLNLMGQAENNRFFALNVEHATAVDVAEGFILLKRYQDKGDFESACGVARKLREIGTSAGQTVQTFSILGRLTPEGMAVYAQKELDAVREEMIRKHSEVWVEQRKDMFSLSAEEMQFIKDNMIAASKLPDGREKNILIAKIASMLEEKLPKKVLRQIQAYTRVSMLLNSKTMLRNVLGNAIMMPMYVVEDFVGAGFDKALATKSGVRTKGVMHFDKKTGKAVVKGVYESYDDFRKHVNTRDIQNDRFELGGGDAFRHYSLQDFKDAKGIKRVKWVGYGVSDMLNAVDRINSFLLDMGDRPFFEFHFTNSINNQLRLNNATEPTADMIRIATTEALQRTWQDDNAYTKAASQIRNMLNGGKSWGIGSIIVPFTKTPTNLTKALIEYSPAGLVKAITYNAHKYSNSLKNAHPDPAVQKAFVDSFAKGVTGTLVMAIAYALANAGLISGGDDDKDKDLAAFEKNIMGIAPYSVTVNGKSYSYDWMQPVGGIFAITADYVQNVKAGNSPKVKGLDTLGTYGKAILNALSAGGNVLFEQSFLQGVSELFGDDGLMGGLISSVANAPTQAISTALSQIAQLADPYVRTSYVYRDTLSTAANKVNAKLPWKRKELAPVVDVLGHDVLAYGGNNSFANVFLNPSNIYSETATDAAKEIYRVYEETGDATVIPRVAPYYFEYDDKRYTFTPHERADYQRATGSANERIVNDLKNTYGYMKLSDEDKAKALALVTDYATANAKYEYLAEHDVKYERDSWMIKAAEGVDNGVTEAEYIVAKTVTKGIVKGLPDNDGETYDNSRSLLIMEAIYSIPNLNDEKRKYLFESFGVGSGVIGYTREGVQNTLSQMRAKTYVPPYKVITIKVPNK